MTAGNSTPLTDGAAAVLLGSEDFAREHNLPMLANFVDFEAASVDFVRGREGLLMAPAYAVPRLLERNGLTLQDFDFYEIHEAFAGTVLSTLAAWEDADFCRNKLGLDAAAGADRPQPAQRQRLLAGRRTPVRRHRRAHRGHPREAAPREGVRPRPGLRLRGRRAGRRRDPGGALSMDTGTPAPRTPGHVPGPRQLRPDQGDRQEAGPAAAGDPAPAPPRGPAGARARARPRRGRRGRSRRRHPARVGAGRAPARRRCRADRRDRARLDSLRAARGPLRARAGHRAGAAPAGARAAVIVAYLHGAGDDAGDPARAAARRGAEGFLRSLGRELRGGATANGIVLGGETLTAYAPSAVAALRFLLSGRSAYVDGQFVRVDTTAGTLPRTGSTRSRARSPSSPGPRAASARPSPAPCAATAPPSSRSTSPPRARRWRPWPTRSAEPPCSWTSRAPDAGQAILAPRPGAPRTAGHRGAQRRHHPRQAAGQHGRSPAGTP